MKRDTKICVGIIVGIIAGLSITTFALNIETRVGLSAIGFFSLIALPIYVWGLRRKWQARNRILGKGIKDIATLDNDMSHYVGKGKKEILEFHHRLENIHTTLCILDEIKWGDKSPNKRLHFFTPEKEYE